MSLCAIIPAANLQAANDALEAAGKYYVYVHMKPSGEPFYVGKGHGNRWLAVRRRNKHHTRCLNKYGLEALIVFDGLEESVALRKESEVIKAFREQGYALANYTDGGQGSSGYKHTPEALQKMREASTGKTYSRESIDKGIESRKYYRHSEETKNRISAAHKGKTFSEESKRKMSDSQKARASEDGYVNPRKGVKLSDSTKEKLSSQRIGKKMSKQTIERMSAALRGRVFSAEHRAKIGAATRERAARKRGESNG